MSTVRLRRLTADAKMLQEYVKAHPRLRMIQTQGTPAERYQIEYRIKCWRQVGENLEIVKSHIVEIYLPRNYPRTPPQCRMLSPVFHPNIAPHAICVGDHWSAGESLFSIVTRIGEILAYQSYNVKGPLNGEAARWVQEHEDQLPLDRVSMLVDENRLTQQEPAASVDAPQVPAPPPIPEPVDPDQVDDNEFIVDEDQHDDSAQGTEDDDYVDDAFLESPANSAPLKRSTPQPARTTMSEPTIADDKMKISCPSCEKVSVVPKTAAGRKAQCLQCHTSFRIPSA